MGLFHYRFNNVVLKKLVHIIFAIMFSFILNGCNQEDESLFKSQCQQISYEDLARNPQNFKDVKVTYTGKVFNVIESGEKVELLVDSVKSGDLGSNLLWVNYTRKKGENRVLENDVVAFLGVVKGTKQYKNVQGVLFVVPEIDAKYISLSEKGKPTTEMPTSGDSANAGQSTQGQVNSVTTTQPPSIEKESSSTQTNSSAQNQNPTVSDSSATSWIADNRTGTKVWNTSPQRGESIIWQGGQYMGYADGNGILYWYRNGVFHHKTEGTWEHGVMKNGTRAVSTYQDGTRKEGYVVNGVINYQ